MISQPLGPASARTPSLLQYGREMVHWRRIMCYLNSPLLNHSCFFSHLTLNHLQWHILVELFQNLSTLNRICLSERIKSLPLKKGVLRVTFCYISWCVFGEGMYILYNLSRTISKYITSSISLTTSLMASLCSQSFAKWKLGLRLSHTCSLPIVSDVSSVEKTTNFRKRIHPWSISSLSQQMLFEVYTWGIYYFSVKK